MERSVEDLSQSLAEVIARFETEEMEACPAEVRVIVQQGLVLVHIKGVLSPSECALARTDQGQALLQRFNNRLFDEGSSPSIREQVAASLGREVVEVQTTLSPLTGSLAVVFTLQPAAGQPARA